MIRQTRKKFETEELRTESTGNQLLRNDSVWNIGSDVSTTSQRVEDEEENEDDKNVDVVSDVGDNDKEVDIEKSSDASNSGLNNRDSSETKAGNDVTDGQDIKPLENGLSSQQSNIHNNSDIENIEDIHETIYLLRKRIRELENKENDSVNNESPYRSLPSMA
ncbi:unnamed protein product [Oppiella nova]|uniref:Uncharacterized protein n=1 Tax=Oppiella nova TaxID=334625 RepID=A0A7R9QA81_9ACAR|nr:unnamed protein product [Oppiella nova]CAG2158294.1 unnamed protein product [Oppiella nova]